MDSNLKTNKTTIKEENTFIPDGSRRASFGIQPKTIGVKGSPVDVDRSKAALEPTARTSGNEAADRRINESVSRVKTTVVELEVASTSQSTPTSKPLMLKASQGGRIDKNVISAKIRKFARVLLKT